MEKTTDAALRAWHNLSRDGAAAGNSQIFVENEITERIVRVVVPTRVPGSIFVLAQRHERRFRLAASAHESVQFHGLLQIYRILVGTRILEKICGERLGDAVSAAIEDVHHVVTHARVTIDAGSLAIFAGSWRRVGGRRSLRSFGLRAHKPI